MSTSWNLEGLRAHIRKTLGPGDLLDTVDSIDRSVQIFGYHLCTARDAMNGVVDDTNPTGAHNVMLAIGGSEKQGDYHQAKIVNEAHLIACIHAARNMHDMFSQLVNGLVLSSHIPVHECDIGRVHRALPASTLKTEIGSLLDSYWYKYVVGFINTAKHRRLVRHKFTVSFESNSAGIKLDSFNYKGQQFPSYWGNEVLQGALDVKNAIVICDRELNAECGAANA